MARDLRKFIEILEQKGQLRRIKALVDPDLEIAEISNRMLQAGGPALLFENVKGSPFPVAVNVMGTVERICWAMNMEAPEELETLGKKLAMLQQPKPPKKKLHEWKHPKGTGRPARPRRGRASAGSRRAGGALGTWQ